MAKKTPKPQEVSQIYRNLKWYIKLKWVAVFALGIVGLVQNYLLAGSRESFYISVFVVAIFIVINWVSAYFVKVLKSDSRRLERLASTVLYIDLAAILFGIIGGGGVEAEIVFLPFIFLIAAIMKDLRFMYEFTAVTIFIYVASVLLQYFTLFPLFGLDAPKYHEPLYVYPLLAYNVAILYSFVLVYTFVIRLRDEREARLSAQAKEIEKETKLLFQQNRELTKERALTEKGNETLSRKLNELERVYRFTLGREKRIVELKKELAKYKK